jgi:hypothetical protein
VAEHVEVGVVGVAEAAFVIAKRLKRPAAEVTERMNSAELTASQHRPTKAAALLVVRNHESYGDTCVGRSFPGSPARLDLLRRDLRAEIFGWVYAMATPLQGVEELVV